jgi:hypothetical protein
VRAVRGFKLPGLVLCILLVAALATYVYYTRPPSRSVETVTSPTTTSVVDTTPTSTVAGTATTSTLAPTARTPQLLEVRGEPGRVVYKYSAAGSEVEVVVSWRVISDRRVLEEVRSELNKTLTSILKYSNCSLPLNTTTGDLPGECKSLLNEHVAVFKALKALSEEVDLVGLLEVNVTITNTGEREVVVLGTCPWTSFIKIATMRVLGTSDSFGFDEYFRITVVQGRYISDLLYRCLPLYFRVLRSGESITNIFYVLIVKPSESEPFRGEFYVKLIGVCEGVEVNCSSLEARAPIEW